MALLDLLADRIRKRGDNLATASADFRLTWPSSSRSGITVTDDIAMGLTAVYRCVVLISSTAAGLPLHVYQGGDGGDATRLETQQNSLIWDRPNPEMTRQTFWEAVIGHEVMGDAFIFVVKNDSDAPLQLWYIEPWRVEVGRTKPDENGKARKVYKLDGKSDKVLIDFTDGGEIIHVPNWSRESLRGISPIKAASAAIALGIASQDTAERFFNEDSVPRGALKHPDNLSQEEADDLMATWQAQNTGRRRTALLAGGLEYQTIAISPEDAQLMEQRGFQLGEIARLFGVPPHMIGDTEKSTSWGSGIEEQTRGFLTYTLQPHINRFEQAINDALLKKGETGRYVKFELGALLRPSLFQRYQAHAMAFAKWETANDIRRFEDMPPIDGGDALLAPMNLSNAEDAAATATAGADAETRVPAADEEVAALALNGAQIGSLLEVLQGVSAGLLAPDTARGIILVSFPSVPEERVNQMVDSAASFVPMTPPEPDTPPPTPPVPMPATNGNGRA